MGEWVEEQRGERRGEEGMEWSVCGGRGNQEEGYHLKCEQIK